jgi:hypothetical protein
MYSRSIKNQHREATVSDIAENKRIAVSWLDNVSAGNIEQLCEMTAPTWTMEGGPPDLPAGHEGLRTLFGTFGEIKQEWTADIVVAEDDKVVVRATNRCTQDSFLGIPARGIEQVFTATFVMQIVDGLVTRTWRNAADLQRLLQLGARLLPPDEPRPRTV